MLPQLSGFLNLKPSFDLVLIKPEVCLSMKHSNSNRVNDQWMFYYLYPVMALLIVHIDNGNSIKELIQIPSYYSDILLALFCSLGIGFYFRRIHSRIHGLFDWIENRKAAIKRVLLAGIILPTVIILLIEIIYLVFFLQIPLQESSIFILELPVIIGYCVIINLIYLFLYARKSVTELSQKSSKEAKYQDEFLLDKGSKSIRLKSIDIAYFKTNDRVTLGVAFDGNEFLVNSSLDEIEKKISPSIFFRLNRQYLANRESIDFFERTETRKLKVNLKPTLKDSIFVSKVKASKFEKWISMSA